MIVTTAVRKRKTTHASNGLLAAWAKPCPSQRQPEGIQDFLNADCTFNETTRAQFLSNPIYKQLLLLAIEAELAKEANVTTVVSAKSDADIDIARAAIAAAANGPTCVIGEDTDLLVLIIYLHNEHKPSHPLHFKSEVRNKKTGECTQ